MEGLSADTLGTVLDYAYTGQLPSRLSHIPDLIAVMRAANRFIMPQLLAACRIRLMGTMEPEETDVFELYDAAKEIRDEQTAAMVRGKQKSPPQLSHHMHERICFTQRPFYHILWLSSLAGIDSLVGIASACAIGRSSGGRARRSALCSSSSPFWFAFLFAGVQVERYVMREPNAQWLQGLADDSVAWGQLAKPGSASSELLRQTMVNLLREKSNKRQKTS